MSLQPKEIAPVPEETVRIARAAFPKGNAWLSLRDELGTIYSDAPSRRFLTSDAIASRILWARSGKETASLRSPPLRTVRASYPAHGSSRSRCIACVYLLMAQKVYEP